MAKQRRPINPFYILLVVTGLVFALTACGFGVMTFTDVHGTEILEAAGAEKVPAGQDHTLFAFLDQSGMKVMLIELAVLAVATVGCIVLDTWYERRYGPVADPPGSAREALPGESEK